MRKQGAQVLGKEGNDLKREEGDKAGGVAEKKRAKKKQESGGG